MDELTRSRLLEVLSYDEQRGVLLRKTDQGGRSKAGTPAGTKTKAGYIRINVDGRLFYAHRLIWLYVHGEFPVNVIDHINGIPGDNRISNLRDVTHSVNLQNLKKPQGGNQYLGVSYYANRWWSVAVRDRVRLNLGSFGSPEEARDAYMAAKSLPMDEFIAAARGRKKDNKTIKNLVSILKSFPGFDAPEHEKLLWLEAKKEFDEFDFLRIPSEAKKLS